MDVPQLAAAVYPPTAKKKKEQDILESVPSSELRHRLEHIKTILIIAAAGLSDSIELLKEIMEENNYI